MFKKLNNFIFGRRPIILLILLGFNLFIFNVNITAGNLSIFIDLKSIFQPLSDGGIGFGLGWELNLKNYFSLCGKFVYMNLFDVEIWAIYYLQGIKIYFDKNAFDKLFLGIYGVVLYGKQVDIGFSYGLQIELGYKWRIEGFEKFYLEPIVFYPYIFNEPLLLGIAFGLNVGIIF